MYLFGGEREILNTDCSKVRNAVVKRLIVPAKLLLYFDDSQ